jgi:hypothetical protein
MSKQKTTYHDFPLDTKVTGISGSDCLSVISFALNLLEERLPRTSQKLVSSVDVVIANGLINSGAQTIAEDKKIILDAEKNSKSLDDAEKLLVNAKILNKGDWTKALPHAKHEPWSCLSYQLVHEFGHLLDGLNVGSKYNRLNASLSPTKYGSVNSSEAFAEAFAYWIFDLPLEVKAKEVIDKITS